MYTDYAVSRQRHDVQNPHGIALDTEPELYLRVRIGRIVGEQAIERAQSIDGEAYDLDELSHPVLSAGQEAAVFAFAVEAGDEQPRYDVSTYRLLTREDFVAPILASDPATREQWRRLLVGCATLCDLIVACNQSFVTKVAVNYRGIDLSFRERMDGGNEGLLGAFAPFKPGLGNRFLSFAESYIYRGMQDADAAKHNLARHELEAWRIARFFQAKFAELNGRDLDEQELFDLVMYCADYKDGRPGVSVNEATKVVPLIYQAAAQAFGIESYEAAREKKNNGVDAAVIAHASQTQETTSYDELSQTVQAALAALPAEERQAVLGTYDIKNMSPPDGLSPEIDPDEDDEMFAAAVQSLRKLLVGDAADASKVGSIETALAELDTTATMTTKVQVLIEQGYSPGAIATALKYGRQDVGQAIIRLIAAGTMQKPATAYEKRRQQARSMLEAGSTPKQVMQQLTIGTAALMSIRIELEDAGVVQPSSRKAYYKYFERHATPEQRAFKVWVTKNWSPRRKRKRDSMQTADLLP